MRVTLFKNKRGLIHGNDPKRIVCEKAGILRIGKTEIDLEEDDEAIMPMLFYGYTGEFDASFETGGEVYDLGKISLRGGWIQAPSPTALELMELRCRAEHAEARLDALEKHFLRDPLRFLI